MSRMRPLALGAWIGLVGCWVGPRATAEDHGHAGHAYAPRCVKCGRPLFGRSVRAAAPADWPSQSGYPYPGRACPTCPTEPGTTAPGAVDPITGGPAAPGMAAPAPGGVVTPAPGLAAPAAAAPAPAPAPLTSARTGGFQSGAGGASDLPMLGDLAPIGGPIGGLRGPSPIAGGFAGLSRARLFKIADNQIPKPTDRLFFTFNYFEDVGDRINRRLNSNVFDIKAYRYLFGFEKTFADGRASFGLRLPLNVLEANNSLRNQQPPFTDTSTALGDLFLYSKFILKENAEKKSLLSGGVALTIPTGPPTFAGAQFIRQPHNLAIQPYLGYYRSFGKFYLIGFEAIDVPFSNADATVIFSDLALGYLLYQNPDPEGLISLVAPVFEVHANIPLNHRNPYLLLPGPPVEADIAGTPDVVNLTYGISTKLKKNALISLGLVTPVTGPRPFDFEALLLLNYLY